MEDIANDATEPEAQPEESGKRPNRFLARLGWTVGRGVRAVAGGVKWVGGGLQSLSPEGGVPLSDEGAVEDSGPGSEPEEPVTGEGEREVEDTAKKSGKKSKKE